jgi:aspartyl-tRNA(Asn)/glutamyl-tRNA(Gln) amidotransferase subunit A
LSDEGIFLARPERPREGIPLAVKDLFDTAGLETTYGSTVFAGHVPEATAEAVVRLEAAGYTNVGKTNLHEFAYGVTSQNPHYGTVPNPAAPGRIAGGSSGGSAAALAAGLADAALGTDSGGSIRIPAACCSVVGLKPTYGLVSLDGCFPLAPTFDHAGPMARTVADCARMLEALVPAFTPAPTTTAVVGLAWSELAEPPVPRGVEKAAQALAARSVEFPFPEGIYPLFMREVADVHRDLVAEHAEDYGENVRHKVERCLRVGDAEVEAALRARESYRAAAEAAMEGIDLLLTPTLPILPPPADVEELEVRETLIRFTFPFNVLGWPALAVPVEGASAQLVGRPGDDALVLAVGASLERGTP